MDKFVTFDDFYKNLDKKRYSNIDLYCGIVNMYLSAIGCVPTACKKYLPDRIQKEYEIAQEKRKEISQTLSVSDWKYLFKKAHNGPIKGFYKKKIEALGGSIEDLV